MEMNKIQDTAVINNHVSSELSNKREGPVEGISSESMADRGARVFVVPLTNNKYDARAQLLS